MNFIDSNMSFGIRRKVNEFSVFEKSEIKNELIKCGIVKAIASHSIAKEFDAKVGNEFLINEIKDDDFFIPAFSAIPNNANDFMNSDELIASINKNHVKLVKLYPALGDHNFSLSTWCSGELLEALSKNKTPVMLSYSAMPSNDFYKFIMDNKDLNIIVTDSSYFHDRNLMKMLNDSKNLYIESSGLRTLDAIEYITNNFGSERLIFGSGMPSFTVGAAVNQIIYAKVSQEDKEKIAYKNIQNLIGEVIL